MGSVQVDEGLGGRAVAGSGPHGGAPVSYHARDFEWESLRAAAQEYLARRDAGEAQGPFTFGGPGRGTERPGQQEASPNLPSIRANEWSCREAQLPVQHEVEFPENSGSQSRPRLRGKPGTGGVLPRSFLFGCRGQGVAETASSGRTHDDRGLCTFDRNDGEMAERSCLAPDGGFQEGAGGAWEAFHARHASAQFFKQRRYLLQAFPEVQALPAGARVLEVGCGSGSSVVPLLVGVPQVSICACDCSPTALEQCRRMAWAALEGCQRVSGESQADTGWSQAGNGGECPMEQRLCTFLCDAVQEDLCSCHDDAACQVRVPNRGSDKVSIQWSKAQEAGPKERGGGGDANDSLRQETDADASMCSQSPAVRPPASADELAAGEGGAGDGSALGKAPAGQGHAAKFQAVFLIFTLSACHPREMPRMLENIRRCMDPGGMICFRDYGMYDMAMMRFRKEQEEEANLYRREDGTLAYFFSKECVLSLFAACGFTCMELDYCCVKNVNRLKSKAMWRVWINGKFILPQ